MAKSIIIAYNGAPSYDRGAIYLPENSFFPLEAQFVLFIGNYGRNGGAIFIRPTAVLRLSGNVNFESNVGNRVGAVFLYEEHITALGNSSFWYNRQLCRFHGEPHLPRISHRWHVWIELSTIDPSTTACPANGLLCDFPTRPASPPPPSQCSGLQPTSARELVGMANGRRMAQLQAKK
jgi:hypothetical protein